MAQEMQRKDEQWRAEREKLERQRAEDARKIQELIRNQGKRKPWYKRFQDQNPTLTCALQEMYHFEKLSIPWLIKKTSLRIQYHCICKFLIFHYNTRNFAENHSTVPNVTQKFKVITASPQPSDKAKLRFQRNNQLEIEITQNMNKYEISRNSNKVITTTFTLYQLPNIS